MLRLAFVAFGVGCVDRGWKSVCSCGRECCRIAGIWSCLYICDSCKASSYRFGYIAAYCDAELMGWV